MTGEVSRVVTGAVTGSDRGGYEGCNGSGDEDCDWGSWYSKAVLPTLLAFAPKGAIINFLEVRRGRLCSSP